MPKKYRLESQYDSDFTLIGIISHQRDYRLIWSINNQLQLNMIKMDDLKIFQDKKNENNFFSFYYFDDPLTFKTFYFISNMGSNGLLFPEKKQTNFFLLIKGNVSPELRNDIILKLNENSYVLNTHAISISSIKNIDNFFSDMELDMMEMNKKNNSPN